MTFTQEAMEKEKKEGKREALVSAAETQLEKKFNTKLPEDIKKGIKTSDINILTKIIENIFEINTLDEVRKYLK